MTEPISLSAPRDTGPSRPYVKLNDIGDSVVMAIGNIDRKVAQTHYDTQQPLVWYNRMPTPLGSVPQAEQSTCDPVTGTGITGVVMNVSGDAIGRMGGEDVVLAEGDEVTIYVDGGKNGNQGRFQDAERDAGDVKIGHVYKYHFDRTEPASNPRYNDRKILTSAIRPPKPEELQKYREQCEAIWQGFQDMPQVSTPDPIADTFGPGTVDASEDPF